MTLTSCSKGDWKDAAIKRKLGRIQRGSDRLREVQTGAEELEKPEMHMLPSREMGRKQAMSEESSRPEVSFAAFVISLASNAAVHFGDLPDPVSQRAGPPIRTPPPR